MLLKGRVGGEEAIRRGELQPPCVRWLVWLGPRPTRVGSTHRLTQSPQTLPANLWLDPTSDIGVALLKQRVELTPRLLPLREWKQGRGSTATSHIRPGAAQRSRRRPLRKANVDT
jgi:hypothetical protein